MKFSVASTTTTGDGEEEEKEEELPEWLQEQLRKEAQLRYLNDLGDTDGRLEGPIDLNIGRMEVIELEPLRWYNHHFIPKKVKLTNSGTTIILCAMWRRENPYLLGGPLLGKYTFSQLHFHWGHNELVGSEHYADGQCMPMELHAVHYKADYGSQEEALRHRDGIVMLVYLFKLFKNRSFNCLLEGFARIVDAGESTRIALNEPITTLLRPFADDYILYWSALTLGVSNRVMWLVSREPIGIAQEQIALFRTVKDAQEQPILGNCRPMPDVSPARHVFHVNPSGHTHATLKIISPDPVPPTANQNEDEDDIRSNASKVTFSEILQRTQDFSQDSNLTIEMPSTVTGSQRKSMGNISSKK